jgi:hypothetical protein
MYRFSVIMPLLSTQIVSMPANASIALRFWAMHPDFETLAAVFALILVIYIREKNRPAMIAISAVILKFFVQEVAEKGMCHSKLGSAITTSKTTPINRTIVKYSPLEKSCLRFSGESPASWIRLTMSSTQCIRFGERLRQELHQFPNSTFAFQFLMRGLRLQ